MLVLNPKRIILDCDPGVDDAIAIILALKSKSIIVDSITVVSGNVDVGQCTINTLRILEFMGRSDIPVVSGASQPLMREPVNSSYVFGDDGLGNMSHSLPYTAQPIEVDVIEHILDRVRSGKIDAIVAIGPLTNIANAYRTDEMVMNTLRELVVMGGAFDVPGNVTQLAEFNFYCDPQSADYVFRVVTNVRMIPLDVTVGFRFTQEELLRIPTSISELICEMCNTWFIYNKKQKLPVIQLHDPLAILALIAMEDFEFHQSGVQVSENGQSVKQPGSNISICSGFAPWVTGKLIGLLSS